MISAPPKFVVNTLDESTIEKIELFYCFFVRVGWKREGDVAVVS